MATIDLNLDAGESKSALANGTEEDLYRLVSSVNIACGGHTGDVESMTKAVDLAKKYNLRIGAHPSFPDKENFGRESMKISHEALVKSLVSQIRSLRAICAEKKVTVGHIKPHGALYNMAAQERVLAGAVIEAAQEFHEHITMIGLAGSPFLRWCKASRFRALAEGFCDRRYEADGTLRGRQHEDAVISDPQECGKQAVRLAQEGKVQTLCIHSDTPNALAVATAVRSALETAGFSIGLAARGEND